MAVLLNSTPSLPQTLISSTSSTLPSPNPKPSPCFLRHGNNITNIAKSQPKSLLSTSNAFKAMASSSNHHVLGFPPLHLFQEFGFNDKESQALFHKNPSLAYTSPESLRHRFVSLQSLGFLEFSIWRLITKRPEILTANEIEEFLDFIRENLEGIETEKLERLLITTEPRFLVGFAEKVGLLMDNGIPEEKIVHFINSINLKVFCRREAKEIERTLVFLNRYDVSVILRRPMLLNLDLDCQIIPRTAFFAELGGDDDAIRILLRKFPPILSYTVEHLEEHTEFWRSIGLRDDEIFKIVLIYPGVFSVSKERKLQPRIEFLKECGLNANDMFRFLTKAPLFLSLSFDENLSKKLGFLVKLGYKHRTKELALAMGAVTRTSCENMQLVIEVFLSYGFSDEDVFAMSKRHPQVLQYNHSSLEKKMEYLIEDMGREIGELLAFPAFLGYKLDERIKQRYEVKKEVRGKGMSLNKLLSVSTERFLKKKASTEMEV